MYHFITRLLEPLSILLLLLGVALMVQQIRCQPRKGLMRCIWLIYLLLVLISLPAVSYLALGTLEWQYAPDSSIPADRQAIIVLSGHLREVQNDTETVLGDDTLYRCLKAAQLYKRGRPCPLIVSGGKVDPDAPGPTLAKAMQLFLVSQGITADEIILEDESHTTHENAVNTAKLIRDREIGDPILLVTDITHLARSELCFEKQGIEVVPVGCRFNPRDFEWSYDQFIPSPGALDAFHDVVHEWLGMGWYRLRNKI